MFFFYSTLNAKNTFWTQCEWHLICFPNMLSAQTYSVGGDSLRSLTEKLRAVAHTLQMSIQGRWRVNTIEGQSATKLPQQVLQAVVDVITASNGLASMLSRWESQSEPQNDVYRVCIQPMSLSMEYCCDILFILSHNVYVFYRYQFAQQTGYTANEKITTLCKDLDTTVHKVSVIILQCFKGSFHPKMKTVSLVAPPQCCYKPIWHSFIYETLLFPYNGSEWGSSCQAPKKREGNVHKIGPYDLCASLLKTSNNFLQVA